MPGIKVFLFLIILLASSISLFAVLMGEGEVTGEVVESWLSGERVIFRLNISEQKNIKGPKLGDGNNFSFDGPSKMQITTGDIIKLHYNSSDGYGVLVGQVEFIDNKPGDVQKSHYVWWGAVLLVIVVAITIFGLLKRRRS